MHGRLFVDGITAMVHGALDAGCDFFAGYPITPASGILMSMMRELPRRGGVAVQGEDEIASIGMCIGAAMSGSRALTATSGPGMSLYSESLGLAVMGEVPLVVVDVQRLGPATGGATTVGQGDVQFARWGTSGGYPLIVLAPWSIATSYRLTVEAFDLAERFRCPVIVLTDKELALTTVTADALTDREVRVRARDVATTPGPPYRYQPPDGVPPLRPYGSHDPVRFTGSTHDETAVITKDPATIAALNHHLNAKVEDHRDEIERMYADLDPSSTVAVVTYGITAGAALEAAAIARDRGDRLSVVIVESLWPVPETGLSRSLDGLTRVVVPELNLGQYSREIDRITAAEVVSLTRVDGEQITPEQILEVSL